jgi:hypothetical protein
LRLADDKVPERFKVIDRIPRNALGKIERRAGESEMRSAWLHRYHTLLSDHKKGCYTGLRRSGGIWLRLGWGLGCCYRSMVNRCSERVGDRVRGEHQACLA